MEGQNPEQTFGLGLGINASEYLNPSWHKWPKVSKSSTIC